MAGSHFTGPVYSQKGFYGPTYTYATLPAASSVNPGTSYWTTDQGWYTSNGVSWVSAQQAQTISGYRAILLGDSLNANYSTGEAITSVTVSNGLATVTVIANSFAYSGDYIVMFNPGDPTSVDEWSGKWIQVVDNPSTTSFRFATSKPNGTYTNVNGQVWQYKSRTLVTGMCAYSMINAWLGAPMNVIANFAQGGTTSAVTVGLVPKVLTNAPKIDIAFIQMGTNDINNVAVNDATAKSSAATVIANYTTVCNQLLAAGITPVIGVMPFFSSPANKASFISGVSITSTAGQFSCTSTSTLYVGQSITISGTYGGTGSIVGYSNPTTYYIIATDGSSTFTLSATLGGAAITTTVGTPTGLTYTNINANQAVSIVRRGLRDYASKNPRCIIVDHQENFGLGTDTNGASIANSMYTDGVHALTYGYYYSGKQLLASGVLGGNLRTLPTASNTIWVGDDGFTGPVSLTGRVNLVPNPSFSGTTGSNGGNAITGNIPTMWRLSTNTLPASTGVSSTPDIQRTVPTNGNPNVANLTHCWQLNLTATAANQELDIWGSNSGSLGFPTKMVAGQWYRAGITVTATNTWTNVKQFAVSLYQNAALPGLTNGSIGSQSVITPVYSNDSWPLVSGDSITLATDLFYIPAGSTWANCFLRVDIVFSAAGVANFQLSNPFCVGGFNSPYT